MDTGQEQLPEIFYLSFKKDSNPRKISSSPLFGTALAKDELSAVRTWSLTTTANVFLNIRRQKDVHER